ncbi:porin family protein [Pedobacter psychrodurus]|uniref:porin family protein n=1 Tax=Pedobacter psychrodurus TaxID=2530456 RepID=UPI002931CF18|nr:porin family protein [Pedobacter psychrodurus]
MKNTALLLLVLPFSLTAYAQRKPLPITVKAGVTFPKMITNNDAIAYDGGGISENSVNPSFYFGATVDIALGKSVSFQPGFSVVGKGTRALYSSFSPNNNISGKINLLYFEIPANAVTYIPVGKDRLFFGLGPYIGIALSGTAKYTYTNTDVVRPDKQNIKFGADQDFKRFDFGGNALAGYQLNNGLNVHAGISTSLLKISNSKDTYLKAKNLVYSIGLGFSL